MKRQGACGAGLKWERQGIVRSRERERQRVEDAGGRGKGWELQMQTGRPWGGGEVGSKKCTRKKTGSKEEKAGAGKVKKRR